MLSRIRCRLDGPATVTEHHLQLPIPVHRSVVTCRRCKRQLQLITSLDATEFLDEHSVAPTGFLHRIKAFKELVISNRHIKYPLARLMIVRLSKTQPECVLVMSFILRA
jgi:hypothetical protein